MSKTSSLDVSVKQWCNWRSPRNLVRPIPRHLIPFTWFTCSGNIVWMLLYPWQWTPADALVPAPVTGWSVCMDAGWAVPWLVLSDLGIGSGSPLQKTQLAVFPPSHHAYACCIPHDLTLPPGPGDHAPVEWNVSARMSHWLTGKDAFFPCIRCECLKTIVCTIRISNSVTKKKRFSWTYSLKNDKMYPSTFSASVVVWKSHLSSGRLTHTSDENISITLSAVAFALSLPTSLCPSPPAQIKRNLF